MTIIRSFIILIVQLVLGYILQIGVYFVGIGNGLEMIALPVVSTLAVWGAGVAMTRRSSTLSGSLSVLARLITTGLGSAFAVWLIIRIGAVGFVGIFALPLLGALFGYYFVTAQALVGWVG